MISLETISRGGHVFGITVFADQRRKMARLVLAGYGLTVAFNIMIESLTWAIQETIESPKYVLLFSFLTLLIVACKYSFSNNR